MHSFENSVTTKNRQRIQCLICLTTLSGHGFAISVLTSDHLGRLLIIKLLIRLSGLDVAQLSKCLNGPRLGFPGNVDNWEFGWVLKFDFVF